jgi:hypothetical protein
MKDGMPMAFYQVVDSKGREIDIYYYHPGNETERKRALRLAREEAGHSMGSSHGSSHNSGHGMM